MDSTSETEDTKREFATLSAAPLTDGGHTPYRTDLRG